MKSLPLIAKEIGVPIATLRYRLQSFNEFIPYDTNAKHTKTYNDDVECIIIDINSYWEQRKSIDDIMTILSSKYTRDIEIINEPTTPIINQQQINNEILLTIQQLIERLDRQDEMQREINEMRFAINEMSRVDRHKKNWFSRLWG